MPVASAEPAELVERRAADADGAALVAVGSFVVAPMIVGLVVVTVPVVAAVGLGAALGPSLVDVVDVGSSSVLGGGGGMSRAGPLVGSMFGVPDASVVAALTSGVDPVMLRPLPEDPDTAAATSMPASAIAASSPAQGSHGGNARL